MSFIKRILRLPKDLLYYRKLLRLKRRYIWRHRFKVDIGVHPKWSLLKRIKYNSLGYSLEDYFLFSLEENDYHPYISAWERLKLESINGRFADILGEKLLFERIFGPFIHVPHIYCWIKGGKCLKLDAGEQTDIFRILQKQNRLIAKPTRSLGGGFGVHKIHAQEGLYFVDDKAVSADSLAQAVASWEEYILIDFVRQADYSKEIYPNTANSIRVITVRRKSGNFEVVMSFHRFGTKLSEPVDNCSSGGLFACIDMQSGIMSAAVRESEPGKVHSVHPDSGSQIEGVTVPDWEHIKQELLRVHRCFPFFTFFAWDIVVEQTGQISVLEINRGSDLMFQMITPLRDAPLGEFMREYGLLDKKLEKRSSH